CRSIGVLFRVFVPMSLPAVGALVIWVFIFTWNEFFWSLISLQRSAMMTVPIGLRLIVGAHNIAFGNLFAASVIAMVPSVLVFLALRRRIIEGISISGAIK
ncbi:MAG: carbohydrate ABC transporter permease, partial [Spirochaetota bacterium]